MELIDRFAGKPAVLPKPAASFEWNFIDDDDMALDEPEDAADPDPISAFVCVIDYAGESRFITCRRYDIIGDRGYVGAICHTANGYRQFRCDRITAVSDAYTGEVLGDGLYFERFTPKTTRVAVPMWGLTSPRKSLLVAGLNVLAFMAHCDGHWHPLETGPVESFVCSLWLRKEWDGDPPIDEIVAHAKRLAPDADTFFRALDCYAKSRTSSAVLTRAISDLVAADGVICDLETSWSLAIANHLQERAASLREPSEVKAEARALKTVCFSGQGNRSRAEYAQLASDANWTVRGSVRKGLDALVVGGDHSASKIASAEKQGIAVMSYLDWEAIIQRGRHDTI